MKPIKIAKTISLLSSLIKTNRNCKRLKFVFIENSIMQATNLETLISFKSDKQDGVYQIYGDNLEPTTEHALSDFPSLPVVDNFLCSINRTELINSLETVKLFTNTSTTMSPLYNILLDLKPTQSNIIACDGNCMKIIPIPVYELKEDTQLLISPKIIPYLKGLDSELVKIYVNQEQMQIMFSTDNVKIITKLENHKYPTYTDIIPSQFKYQIAFNQSELNKILTELTPYVKQSNDDDLTVTINQDNLNFNFIIPNGLEKNYTLPIELATISSSYIIKKPTSGVIIMPFESIDTPDKMFKIKHSYLLNSINSFDSENLYLCLQENYKNDAMYINEMPLI